MRIALLIFLFLFAGLLPLAQADTVYLKNGHSMDGIVTKETDEYVTLSLGMGSVKFYLWQIERVVRSSGDENKELEKAWEKERLRKEAELERLKEEMERSPKEVGVQRKGNHFIINALLDGKVNARLMLDTGATFVVLSPGIARKLGIDIKVVKPDAKMALADGSEVSAKLFKLGRMNVQNVEAKDVDAAVLFKDEPFSGFDGLLGMSFLKLFKFEIDLEKNRLILRKS